MDILT